MKLKIIPPERGIDVWGSGAFKAPRGDHLHKGRDDAAYPGSLILSPVTGIVTKLGYVYADDLSWRYVEVTHPDNKRHRMFYVEPMVTVGDHTFAYETVIGRLRDIAERYSDPPGITSHVHYEILLQDGTPVDPE